MEVLISAIGRLKGRDARSPEAQLVSRYVERADALSRSVGLRGVRAEDRPESREHETARRKDEEAAALLSVSDGAHRIALDEGGAHRDSRAWSRTIADARDAAHPRLAFLIGGPDGHGPELLARADLTLSLGRATWPHLLARVLVAEQIYRALTILARHPYHRD